MKNLLVFLLLWFSFISISFSQDSLGNFIHTYGRVEMLVPADFASLSFSVSENGSSLREAVEKSKKKVSFITTSLFQLGVKKDNLSTSRFFSGENFGGKSFFSSKNDYKTEITTFIKVDSLEILEEIILTLSDHKPDNISDIFFELDNPETYKMQALENAIKKAKEKANILARVMEVKLTKPIEIIEKNITSNNSKMSNLVIRGGLANPFNSVYQIEDVNKSGELLFREKIKIIAEIELKITIN